MESQGDISKDTVSGRQKDSLSVNMEGCIRDSEELIPFEHIEERYKLFAASNASHIDGKNWFGVNITQGSKYPAFKIYLPGMHAKHWLTRCVERLGMDGYSEVSANSAEPDITRFSIRLRNKTNVNIESLYQAMQERRPWLSSAMDELYVLSGMPVCEHEQRRGNALFFVGANSKDTLDVLKFYYLTRECADIERIDLGSMRNDRLFMGYLSRMRGFKRLLDHIEPLLCGDTHLWMVAADVSEAGICKRKIYVDGTSNDDLLSVASRFGLDRATCELARNIRSVVAWQETWHPSLRHKGFALCEACNGRLSVNLYYREPDLGAL